MPRQLRRGLPLVRIAMPVGNPFRVRIALCGRGTQGALALLATAGLWSGTPLAFGWCVLFRSWLAAAEEADSPFALLGEPAAAPVTSGD
jgi:hypothetical protein